MSKHRIYEIADELDLESKEMLDILDELGMGELTPLNTVDDEEYGLILELYEERKDELSQETEEVAEEEEETVTEEEEEEIEQDMETKEEIVVEKESGVSFDMGKLIKGVGITLLVVAIGAAGWFVIGGSQEPEPQESNEEKQQQTQKEPQQEKEKQEEEEEEKEPVVKKMVTIQETPTGFLRVRGGPGISHEELDQVEPGKSFPFVSQDGKWYEIELPYGNGWVYGDYATTSTTTVSE